MQAINKVLANTPNNNREMKEDEYLGENGFYYCKQCNTPRQCIGFFEDRKVNCLCKCQEAERKKEMALKEAERKRKQIAELLKKSLLGNRYVNARFETSETGFNPSFDEAYKRCKKFCEVAPAVLKRGYGIYMYGDKGTGKTHLTACMVNELTSHLYECLLTNFFEISREIRSTFNDRRKSEEEYIKRMANVDFLFIDDLGTELVQRNGEDNFLQEKIFEIINLRYNNNKPTIFTSNNSLNELINERGFMQKTVDRIYDMTKTAIMRIDGQSYRLREGEKLF